MPYHPVLMETLTVINLYPIQCMTPTLSLCSQRCHVGRWAGPAQCCPLCCIQCVPGAHGEELEPNRVPGHDGTFWDPHQWHSAVGYF